jgi:hypothetical protein
MAEAEGPARTGPKARRAAYFQVKRYARLSITV